MNDTPSPAWIDTHCHLDALADPLNALLAAQQTGIQKIVIPGVTPTQWRTAERLSKQFNGVYFAVGIHPWQLEHNNWLQDNAWQNQATHLAQNPKCVAIGECGLDAKIAPPIENQIQLLIQHIELANRLHLPLILHSVKAHNELVQTLKKHPAKHGGVIHAFSGSYEVATTYWQLGLYIGVGGTITYERANKTRAAIGQMPLESLVLETDAPYMPIEGEQGKPNTPTNLQVIAKQLSLLKNLSANDIQQHMEENTCKLFPQIKFAPTGNTYP